MKHIEFETAILAKEKGFNEFTDDAFDLKNGNIIINYKDNRVKELLEDCENNDSYAYRYVNYLKDSYFDKLDNSDDGYYLSAPYQPELQDWLREKHNINVWVEHGVKTKPKKGNEIQTHDLTVSGIGIIRGSFTNYSKALEAGLLVGLNLIKNEEEIEDII